jgi:uncharacterized protein (DUF1697 family)
MPVRVALLRGVNVSGANKLPMAAFREILADFGLRNVETYIQSGKAVFESDLDAPVLAQGIRDGIAARFSFAPEVFVLDAAAISRATNEHPFAWADPARVHVFFLAETPETLDEAGMQALAAEGDGWVLAKDRFTLHTPAGIGRSRLAEKLHRFIPGQMTARNLRTVAALQAMIASRG